MTNQSVSEYLSLINQQTNLMEELNLKLSKIKSLIAISLEDNFLYMSDNIKHDYLSVLDDVIEETMNFNTQLLGALYEKHRCYPSTL